jgi:hypothetical protein
MVKKSTQEPLFLVMDLRDTNFLVGTHKYLRIHFLPSTSAPSFDDDPITHII